MKPSLEEILIPNQKRVNPTDERIEVTITKEKLQFSLWLLGALLSILSFFTFQILAGIDTLKENSADFKTYIKTNDQRAMYMEQNINNHLKDYSQLETRVKTLEDKDFAFWKEYGWLFRESQKRR